MATYRSGSNSRIVIGKEPSFNTADPTPVGHVLRKMSFTFDGIEERIQNDELRSDPNPAATIAGRQRVTATLQGPLTTDELGVLMTLFFGTYAVTGTSAPYVHEWKMSATEPSSCWVEVGYSEVVKYDLFNGLVPQSIDFGTLDKSSDGLVQVTVTFWASGKYALNGGTAQDASPDVYANGLHAMHTVTVKTDSATTTVISRTNLSLARTITGYGVLDGTAYDSEVDRGKFNPDCTITGWRDSADTLFGLCDGADHIYEMISARRDASDYTVSVEFPAAKFVNSEGSGQVSDGPVLATVRVEPHYDSTDETSCVVTIKSDVADFSAIW